MIQFIALVRSLTIRCQHHRWWMSSDCATQPATVWTTITLPGSVLVTGYTRLNHYTLPSSDLITSHNPSEPLRFTKFRTDYWSQPFEPPMVLLLFILLLLLLLAYLQEYKPIYPFSYFAGNRTHWPGMNTKKESSTHTAYLTSQTFRFLSKRPLWSIVTYHTVIHLTLSATVRLRQNDLLPIPSVTIDVFRSNLRRQVHYTLKSKGSCVSSERLHACIHAYKYMQENCWAWKLTSLDSGSRAS